MEAVLSELVRSHYDTGHGQAGPGRDLWSIIEDCWLLDYCRAGGDLNTALLYSPSYTWAPTAVQTEHWEHWRTPTTAWSTVIVLTSSPLLSFTFDSQETIQKQWQSSCRKGRTPLALWLWFEFSGDLSGRNRNINNIIKHHQPKINRFYQSIIY